MISSRFYYSLVWHKAKMGEAPSHNRTHYPFFTYSDHQKEIGGLILMIDYRKVCVSFNLINVI